MVTSCGLSALMPFPLFVNAKNCCAPSHRWLDVRRARSATPEGQLSAATQGLIVAALNATPVTAASTDTIKLNRVAAAVLLVMASSEYLIQK